MTTEFVIYVLRNIPLLTWVVSLHERIYRSPSLARDRENKVK